MFALEPGILGPNLRRLGRALTDLAAIVVVSPHWQTEGIFVGATATPATLHDFGGFPAPLYALQYPAPGAPALASDVVRLLVGAGLSARLDAERGLDHGAWVPLRYLKPEADVPVLQVSMPHDLDPAGALRLGHALAPLRDRGVLIIGSGSLTHNLYEFRQHISDPEYAQMFGNWVADAVARHDEKSLINYRVLAPFGKRAHPTEEHFLPLLVAVGASKSDEPHSLIRGGMAANILSMDSFGFGLSSDAMAKSA
jgi:4,5-DOPA dioxygenase extradiol